MFLSPKEFTAALASARTPEQAQAIVTDFRNQIAAGCTPWLGPVISRRKLELDRIRAEGVQLLKEVVQS